MGHWPSASVWRFSCVCVEKTLLEQSNLDMLVYIGVFVTWRCCVYKGSFLRTSSGVADAVAEVLGAGQLQPCAGCTWGSDLSLPGRWLLSTWGLPWGLRWWRVVQRRELKQEKRSWGSTLKKWVFLSCCKRLWPELGQWPAPSPLLPVHDFFRFLLDTCEAGRPSYVCSRPHGHLQERRFGPELVRSCPIVCMFPAQQEAEKKQRKVVCTAKGTERTVCQSQAIISHHLAGCVGVSVS